MNSLPLSSAVALGDVLFIGGTTPADPQGNISPDWQVAEQTERVLLNLERVLQYYGRHLFDILFIQVYLSDLSYYQCFNEIYERIMSSPYPARKVTLMQFSNPNLKVELTGFANCSDKQPVFMPQ